MHTVRNFLFIVESGCIRGSHHLTYRRVVFARLVRAIYNAGPQKVGAESGWSSSINLWRCDWSRDYAPLAFQNENGRRKKTARRFIYIRRGHFIRTINRRKKQKGKKEKKPDAIRETKRDFRRSTVSALLFFRLCPLFNRDESRDINYPEIYTVHFVKQSCTRNHVKMEKFRYTVCAKPSPVIYSHFNITTIVSRTFFFSPVCASHFDSVTPSVTLFFTRTLLRRIFACYIFPRLILWYI